MLIAFFHVTYFPAFLSGTSFLSCCTTIATDLAVLRIFNSQAFFTLHSFPTFVTVPRVLRIWWSFFLLSGVFYFILLPDIWRNQSRLPWEPSIFPWSFQGSPLRFGTLTLPICLFEPHSSQQKVLVDRFYLCAETRRNTVSDSSRF